MSRREQHQMSKDSARRRRYKSEQKERRKLNRQAMVTSVIFCIIFVFMAGFYLNFIVNKSQDIIKDTHNERVAEKAKTIIRGTIYAEGGEKLAYTDTNSTEEDLSELTKEEKQEMLEAIGLSNSGLDDLIKATYDILGLATYFTVGKDEVRAWTFKKGMNAKECAGIIHTDFEKGFIRAEVISYTDLIECGSELKVKEAGKARLEGKEYLMQDGDICHFRFNV